MRLRLPPSSVLRDEGPPSVIAWQWPGRQEGQRASPADKANADTDTEADAAASEPPPEREIEARPIETES